MQWGRKWGNPWGEDRVTPITITDLGEDPPAALAQWADQGNYLYLIAIDGKTYTVTAGNEITFQVQQAGRHFVEVLLTGPGNMDEDVSSFASAIPGARVKLSWTASIATDLAYYKIYWDQGLGGGLTYLARTKADEINWISNELADGSYKYRINTVDKAGNETTGASTVTVVIDRYPNAPTALALDSYDDVMDEATFTFVESTSAGVVGYHAYKNDGAGGVIDYDTIAATILAGNTDFTLVGIGTGEWKVALRAYDASYEEDNVDVFVEFDISAGGDLLEDPPNAPYALAVIPTAGGTFLLTCSYDCFEEPGVGATINYYRNNGAGGVVNYSSVIASAAIPAHTQGDLVALEVQATSPALTNGLTYIFGVKAATAGGREGDAAATEVSGVADAAAPADITGLTGEAINYEEV